MGWKNVRDYYDIDYNHCGLIIQVNCGDICIGFPSQANAICINAEGNIYNYSHINNKIEDINFRMNCDLKRLKHLVESVDVFDVSIPIYTCDDDGNIILKYCEIPKYPFTTHDGQLIFSNLFSTSESMAISLAVNRLKDSLKECNIEVKKKKNELSVVKMSSAKVKNALSKLLIRHNASGGFFKKGDRVRMTAEGEKMLRLYSSGKVRRHRDGTEKSLTATVTHSSRGNVVNIVYDSHPGKHESTGYGFWELIIDN